MKKFIWISIYLICFFLWNTVCLRVMAQQIDALPSAGSSMTISGMVSPVDHSSGTANIAIPLEEVQTNGIQLPISISYQTTGLKIEDKPGHLGMGWKLNAGGKVTRIVKSYPDGSKPRRWGMTLAEAYTAFFNNVSNDYNNYNGIDTEPDLFYFEIPGRSGMFVFDHLNNAHTIPYQNVSISWINNSYFTIVDDQGTTYTFGRYATSQEKTTTTYDNSNYKPNGGKETVTYVSTWHLDNMVTYQGNRITFSYNQLNAKEYTNKNTFFNYGFNQSTGVFTYLDEKVSETVSSVEESFLKSITWSGGRVDFTAKTGFPQICEKMAVWFNGNLTKTILFTYSSNPDANGRFYLSRLENEFPSGGKSEICSLVYNSRSLPSLTSKDYDHWGYYNYNGTINTTDRPTYVNPSGPTLAGANREPNLESAQANVLTRIAYPTGGYTEYVYELNQYNDGGTTRNTGGLRIREIRRAESATNVQTVSYKYLDEAARSSGNVFTLVKSGYIRYDIPGIREGTITLISSRSLKNLYDINGRHVTYSMVREIQPDGSSTVYKYTNPQEDGNTADVRSQVRYTWIGASNPVNAANPVDHYTYFPESSKFWRRNLLKEVINYDASNSRPVSHQIYHYKLNTAARKVISGFLPYHEETFFVGSTAQDQWVCEYQWESQPVYLQEIETLATAYTPSSTKEYEYNTEYMVPTAVTVTDALGNTTKTVTRYPFQYTFTLQSDEKLWNGVYLLQQNRVVDVIEEVVWRNNQVVSARFREFKPQHCHAGLIAVPQSDYVLSLTQPVTDYRYGWIDAGQYWEYDSRYRRIRNYDYYDSQGRLLSKRDDNYNHPAYESYIYNSFGHRVATVQHAVHADLDYKEVGTWYTMLDCEGFPYQTEDFEVPYAQTVNFKVSKGSASTPTSNRIYTYKVCNSSTNTVVADYEVANRGANDAFSLFLPAGIYHLDVMCDYYDDSTTSRVEYQIYEYDNVGYNRQNQVYYNSFENGTPNRDNAKTGRDYWSGIFQIDVRNFKAGNYVLTYWKSTNGGLNWNKITEDVTITSTSSVVPVGGSGILIDEVRLLPAGARISTVASIPGIGPLSETDHNGNTIYYEYDGQNRLYRIRDTERNLLKEYQYKTIR